MRKWMRIPEMENDWNGKQSNVIVVIDTRFDHSLFTDENFSDALREKSH